MKCAVCGEETQLYQHGFNKGVLGKERPPDWIIEAPMYFAERDRKMLAGFCSAMCGLTWVNRQKDAECGGAKA